MPELIHDPAVHKLGKLAAKPPRLMLRDYVDIERSLPQAPATVENSKGQSIPLAMYLNDKYGCCTCAAVGNTLRVNSGGKVQLTDQDILAAYEAVTGQEGAAFNPATGKNDNGCVEVDVLDHWSATGVGADKLLGHAGVNMRDPDEHRVIAWLFGSVYLGIALAVEQQSQQVWDYVKGSSPGSWGGHAVPEFDVNVTFQTVSGVIVIGTWGAYKAVTPLFLKEQADEGHAPITAEWLAASESNPLVNTAKLQADLAQLAPES